jgi:hypothetical protein
LAFGLLAGFAANPSPQPQRASDIAARLTALEETVAAQADTIAGLEARVAVLEGSAPPATDDAPPAVEITIPAAWEQYVSSDGLVAYWADPEWELTQDEPGYLDFWAEVELAGLNFAYDFPPDMLDDLLNDDRFLEFFQDNLLGDEEFVTTLEDSGTRTFLGEDAYYWEVTVDDVEGLTGRFVYIFYACSEKSACGISHYRFASLRRTSDDVWTLMESFATGVDFLSVGQVTVSSNANLRACPSIDCEVVGRAISGEIIEVIGQSPDGAWIKLRSGEWISASLVDGAPADLPVLETLPGV